MLKALFISFLSLSILVIPSYFIDFQLTENIVIPIKWLFIIVGALLLEKLLKYLLFYPFKFFGLHNSDNPIVKGNLNFSFSAAYISLWLAIGVTPINAVVRGDVPDVIISNSEFLISALFFAVYAVLFSSLWVLLNRKN